MAGRGNDAERAAIGLDIFVFGELARQDLQRRQQSEVAQNDVVQGSGMKSLRLLIVSGRAVTTGGGLRVRPVEHRGPHGFVGAMAVQELAGGSDVVQRLVGRGQGQGDRSSCRCLSR